MRKYGLITRLAYLFTKFVWPFDPDATSVKNGIGCVEPGKALMVMHFEAPPSTRKGILEQNDS